MYVSHIGMGFCLFNINIHVCLAHRHGYMCVFEHISMSLSHKGIVQVYFRPMPSL